GLNSPLGIKYGRNAGVVSKRSDNVAQFNWSYKSEQEDVILVAALFQKVHKKVTLVKTATEQVMTLGEYNKAKVEWDEEEFAV
ncbi:unnamed protein product, partial [marine sediment metagenome]